MLPRRADDEFPAVVPSSSFRQAFVRSTHASLSSLLGTGGNRRGENEDFVGKSPLEYTRPNSNLHPVSHEILDPGPLSSARMERRDTSAFHC